MPNRRSGEAEKLRRWPHEQNIATGTLVAERVPLEMIRRKDLWPHPPLLGSQLAGEQSVGGLDPLTE